MYKLVAIDIDGTLLDDEEKVSKRTVDKIEKLMDMGVVVTLVTGRNYSSTKMVAEDLNINSPLVVFNGAQIFDPIKDELLFNATIPLKETKEIIRLGENRSHYIRVYIDNILYVEKDDERAQATSRNLNIPYKVVGKLSENIVDKATMIILSDEEEKIKALYNNVKMDSVFFTMSTPHSLEFIPFNTNKGTGVRHLCERLNIRREEVLAIGNNLNDLEMLKFAGKGIAIKNSDEMLLDRWNEISKYTNNEDGVYHVLEETFRESAK
ncbi:Cof-type HAD-IIB family hydrolase [Tissierella sp. MSJ-40]|uniref:Cof-type HAD-IIB family hydrolase n=1 Tax=Tissierella simiarum TaxID=2841534 RepID=A0ABS6E161_9FIRM|nr:Cof-type HAD-IIB family hydrolase [Tissierella simiarum]MBU5436640.1 Cof-type HAD-IIB family hydrolase [Tissierella simiarum]